MSFNNNDRIYITKTVLSEEPNICPRCGNLIGNEDCKSSRLDVNICNDCFLIEGNDASFDQWFVFKHFVNMLNILIKER